KPKQAPKASPGSNAPKKPETAKSEMASAVASAYPHLAKNQQQIKQLLDASYKKFAQARELFVKQKGAELAANISILEKEVEAVKRQLIEAETAAGIKQVAVPQFAKAVEKTEHDVAAPVTTPKSETSEKPPKKDKPAAEKKQAVTSGNKKSDNAAAADDQIDVGRLDLRVGRILQCEKHPDADALYVEQIDVEIMEVDPSAQPGTPVTCPPYTHRPDAQLNPKKKVEIMEVDPSAQPGTPVTCPPYTHRPDAQLNPKKKIWETVAEDLKVSADGYAVWKDCPLLVGGSTKMTAPTLRGVLIK
ncbi:tRNA binding domain protein, partial [Teladorsagia circumcincta]